MRTSVTLEPATEALLIEAMKQRGLSFNEALNSAIQAGLTASVRPTPFVQPSFDLGSEQNFRWEKALSIADAMDDEKLAG